MRYFCIIAMLLCFTACKRKEKSAVVKSQAQTVEKNIAVKTLAKDNPASDFPSDSTFTAKILMPGGTFHVDEVDPKSAKYKWMGLFKTDSGYYVAPTKIKLKRKFDTIMDEEGKKTGWGIYPSVKDTGIILVSGLSYLNARPVDSIAFKKDYILPGEHEDFICNGIQYTLYATGINKSTSKERTPFEVSDYKLFLKANIEGKHYEQMIISIAQFDDTICNLVFLGDIDGDGLPDMIIDTTCHYNMERPTLYLSKPAGVGQLLKPVGWFVMVGC